MTPLSASMILVSNLQTLVILILCVDSVLSIGTLPRCPPGWIHNGKSCWMTIQPNIQGGFTAAQRECQKKGGHLAVLNSKAENDFVVQLFKETWPENRGKSLWLGCMAILPNNTLECFESLAGSEEGYYTFHPSNGPGERCVLLHPHGYWFGNDCTRVRYTICERPATRLTTTLQCSAINPNANHADTYCLLDHTFSVTQITSPIQCCITCFKNLDCHSFNLSGKKCHLNNVTISQIDQGKYFKQVQDCGYFEMKWA